MKNSEYSEVVMKQAIHCHKIGNEVGIWFWLLFWARL